MASELNDVITPDRPLVGRKLQARHVLLIVLAAAAVFGIRARWFNGASQAAGVAQSQAIPSVTTNVTKPVLTEPAPETITPVEPEQPTMFGSWRDNYYGERTMTFRPDGTGEMVIKLDAVGQAIYGEKLLFELKWENRDGVLVMQFTGGEPKQAVETISKLWGDRHEQKIELLTETELHLRSTDSQNLYKLKHIDE